MKYGRRGDGTGQRIVGSGSDRSNRRIFRRIGGDLAAEQAVDAEGGSFAARRRVLTHDDDDDDASGGAFRSESVNRDSTE